MEQLKQTALWLARLWPLWIWCALAAGLTRTLKDIGFKVVLDGAAAEFAASTLECIAVFWFVILCSVGPAALWRARQLRRAGKPLMLDTSVAWRAILWSGVINIVAYAMFLESLRFGEFSIATMLRNTVPLWSMVSGLLMAGLPAGVWRRILGKFFTETHITALKAWGSVLVVAGIVGIYSQAPTGLAGEFDTTLYSSLLAVACAFLFVFAAALDNQGVGEKQGGMDPIIYSASLYASSGAGLILLALTFGSLQTMFEIVARWWDVLIWISVFGSLGTVFTALTFRVGKGIINAVPALRIQVIFSVGLGGWFFAESGLFEKLFSAMVLTAGIAMVAWGSRPPAVAAPIKTS